MTPRSRSLSRAWSFFLVGALTSVHATALAQGPTASTHNLTNGVVIVWRI